MKGLGNRIRDIRKAKHLTLVDVAKSSGIDQATLSRIENGKMTGTLDSHRRIAETLGVRLPELYENVMQQIAEAKNKRTIQRPESFSYSGGAVAELLAPGVLKRKMMPVLLKLKRKGQTEKEELPPFSENFIYVLKGSIEVHLGNETRTLNQGDSLYFNASVPHVFRNKLKSESQLLSIVTPVSL